jgi:hypothetical protein
MSFDELIVIWYETAPEMMASPSVQVVLVEPPAESGFTQGSMQPEIAAFDSAVGVVVQLLGSVVAVGRFCTAITRFVVMGTWAKTPGVVCAFTTVPAPLPETWALLPVQAVPPQRSLNPVVAVTPQLTVFSGVGDPAP